MNTPYFRFGLIWMFVAVAVAGFVFAYIAAVKRQRERSEADVVQSQLEYLQECIWFYDFDVGEY